MRVLLGESIEIDKVARELIAIIDSIHTEQPYYGSEDIFNKTNLVDKLKKLQEGAYFRLIQEIIDFINNWSNTHIQSPPLTKHNSIIKGKELFKEKVLTIQEEVFRRGFNNIPKNVVALAGQMQAEIHAMLLGAIQENAATTKPLDDEKSRRIKDLEAEVDRLRAEKELKDKENEELRRLLMNYNKSEDNRHNVELRQHHSPLALLGFESVGELRSFIKNIGDETKTKDSLVRNGRKTWHPDRIQNLKATLDPSLFAAIEKDLQFKFRLAEDAAKEIEAQLKTGNLTGSWPR
jgi:hypothetical protein